MVQSLELEGYGGRLCCLLSQLKQTLEYLQTENCSAEVLKEIKCASLNFLNTLF